jgi:pimeloyl-ACP methyl ester carboxylesterase
MKSPHIFTNITLPVRLETGDMHDFSAAFYPALEKTGEDTGEGAGEGAVFFCLPGGGNSKNYFDLGTVDGFDYSFAGRMNQLGHHVVLMDHPGICDNTLPDNQPFLLPRRAASYIAQYIDGLMQLPEFAGRRIIGTGHSMGGMVTVLTHAVRPYDAICMIGSSAGGLDWGLSDEEKTYLEKPAALEAALEDLVMKRYGEAFSRYTAGPSAESKVFGGESVASTDLLMQVQAPLFSAGATTSMLRGSFMPEVESVEVPMFMGFGAHDLGIPPEQAPKDFINAPHVELMIVPEAGHNSFAFRGIEILCRSIDVWAKNL